METVRVDHLLGLLNRDKEVTVELANGKKYKIIKFLGENYKTIDFVAENEGKTLRLKKEINGKKNYVKVFKEDNTKKLIEQLEKESGKKVILKEEIKDTNQVVYKVSAVQKGYGTSIVIACKAGMSTTLRDKKVMEYFKNFVNFKNYNAPIEITYDYLGSLKLLK